MNETPAKETWVSPTLEEIPMVDTASKGMAMGEGMGMQQLVIS